MRPNDYDAMAAAYSADNEHNAWNALHERPAILALAWLVTWRACMFSMRPAVVAPTPQR